MTATTLTSRLDAGGAAAGMMGAVSVLRRGAVDRADGRGLARQSVRGLLCGLAFYGAVLSWLTDFQSSPT